MTTYLPVYPDTEFFYLLFHGIDVKIVYGGLQTHHKQFARKYCHKQWKTLEIGVISQAPEFFFTFHSFQMLEVISRKGLASQTLEGDEHCGMGRVFLSQ